MEAKRHFEQFFSNVKSIGNHNLVIIADKSFSSSLQPCSLIVSCGQDAYRYGLCRSCRNTSMLYFFRDSEKYMQWMEKELGLQRTELPVPDDYLTHSLTDESRYPLIDASTFRAV